MEYKIRTAVPADEGKIRELFLEMLRTIYHTDDVKGYGDRDLDRFRSENRDRVSLSEVRDWIRKSFEHDYNDLSDRTKEAFLDRYDIIKSVVLGDM